MNRFFRFSVIAALGAVGVGVFIFFSMPEAVSKTDTFTAPGLDPMTVDEASVQFWRLTPALLLEVYEAFGQTEENAIYDSLASVTSGDALEYLYLERVGAMAGGGLEEADQTIHEIKLLDTQIMRDGASLSIDASWQVVGTVGHAEHLGAWRITDFELLDVNRDGAGETFLAPPTN